MEGLGDEMWERMRGVGIGHIFQKLEVIVLQVEWVGFEQVASQSVLSWDPAVGIPDQYRTCPLISLPECYP